MQFASFDRLVLDRLSVLLLIVAASAARQAGAAQEVDSRPGDRPPAGETDRSTTRWAYFLDLPRPADEAASPWMDLIVPPSVFDKARADLGDLRLQNAANVEIPYALRIRRPEFADQQVPASVFNQATGPESSSELSLDLGENPPEHNQVDAPTPGTNFRRRAVLEGSVDGQEWRTILEKNLIRFEAENRELNDQRLAYPPSRFRYLRLRVFGDPAVDHDPVRIGEVSVHRKVEIPGELVTLPATLGVQMPVRAARGPGSAWMIDLNADNMPCETLLVDIGDPVFDRDYRIESAPSDANDSPFSYVVEGRWSRRAGDVAKPLEARFGEVQARRLKLTVTDYRNPPLDVRSVQFQSAARQVVFQRNASLVWPLRLYFGNASAEPPHYDLERNLPARLQPPPERIEPGPRQDNPSYAPEPKPLTERVPWLIYVVLGGASLVLALILLKLARTALAMHDREESQRVASHGPDRL